MILVFVHSAEAANEGNEKCFQALARVMNGQPPGIDIYQFTGSEDPYNVFNHGSENIPVTCRAVKYRLDNNPQWFEGYFDIQESNPNVGLFGNEMFSPVYSSLIAGDVVSVLNHALARGHTPLVMKASKWLRSYWALLALASSTQPVRQVILASEDGNISHAVRTPIPGAAVAIAGARAYDSDYEALYGVLLSMAIEHPNRGYNPSVSVSPGFYGGLRASIEAVGYRLNGNGQANLRSMSVPSQKLGLTNVERAQLLEFVQSNGTSGLTNILSMIGDNAPECDITFLRTTQGVISWFGTSTSSQNICTKVKGGARFASKITSSGVATFLSNIDNENHPEAAWSYRKGQQICAQSTVLPELCIDLPAGNVVYEVSWRKGVGITCVSGSCSGTLPVPPAPPSQPTPTPTPPTAPPPAPSNGADGLLPDSQPLPGGEANTRMIQALYKGILGRAGDVAGVAYWRQLMEQDGTWLGYKRVALAFAKIFQDNHMFNQIAPIVELDHIWTVFVTGTCADQSEWFRVSFLNLMEQGNLEEPLRRILNASYFDKARVQQGPPAQFNNCHR